MAEILKPDFTHLWASTGTIVAPSNSKIDTGWTAEVPPYQWENFSQNRQDNAIAHLFQHGVSTWDSTIEYQAGKSYVQGSNGLIYVALQTHTNQNPTTATAYWQQLVNHGILTFETPGVTNWTVPLAMRLGIVKPKVTVVGAGGAGSRINATAGAGGAAGGAAIGIIDLTGVTSVSITIGAGGVVAATGVSAGSGGTSSFGAYMSATGGNGGSGGGQGTVAGVGTGGTLNLKGLAGDHSTANTTAAIYGGGHGGGSLYGGGGRAASQSTATAGENGQQGGGGAGSVGSAIAGTGGNGIVVIEW